MDPNLVSFYPKFLLDEKEGTTKAPKAQIIDETAYPTATVVPANVDGIVSYAKNQNVQFYSNADYDNPDVTISPATNVKFDLPLDSAKNALYGEYDFKYSIRILNEIIMADGATSAPGAATFDSLFYEGPTIANFISLMQAAIADADLFTIQFLNSSNVVLGSSTVVSAEQVDADLVVGFDSVTVASYASIAKMRFLTYYSDTKQVSYCAQTWPTGVLSVVGDCIKAQISVQDQTEYIASDVLVRTIDFNYPILSDGTPVETAVSTDLASLLVGPNVWTGAYTISLTSVLTRTETDGLVLQYSVIKYNNFILVCDAGLCCMKNCISGIFAKYQEAVAQGSQNLSTLRDNMVIILGYINLYTITLNCGDTVGAAAFLNDLKAYLLSIGCDCGCDDTLTGTDEPTIVYPLFSDPQPNYVPISYLESNDITIDSNSKVPTNKAVINYVEALLESYYTSTQIDDGYYDKATSDSRFVRKNYKEYMAVFTQTTTNPVLVSVLVNDFGAEIDASSFIKGGFDGTYGVVAASGTPFTADKTFVQVGFGEQVSGDSSCGAYRVDNTSLQFWSKTNLTGTDGLFTNATIYIRVYN